MGQLLDAMRKEDERLEERKQQLSSPEFQAQREASKTEHVGVSDLVAEQLANREFGDLLKGAQAGLGLEQLADGREVKEFVDDHTVVLAGDEKRPPVLLESPWPVRAVADDGRMRPVDLSLEQGKGGFEPVNAVADVKLPAQLADGIEVGQLRVAPAGSSDGKILSDGGDRVVYANAQTDTDVVVTPLVTGAEVFWQLRSPRASEELTLDLGLPEGAIAEPTKTGSVAIINDGERMSMVSQPVAIDAQGQDVPVKMGVRGDQIVLSIPHRDLNRAYPLLVDPVVEDYENPNTGRTWFEQDAGSLARLNDWYLSYAGVPYGQYIQRHHCYATVSCDASWADPNWEYYDLNKPDGLHIYVQPGIQYPSGSYAQFIYQAPGTTTRIAEASLFRFYHRRGGSQQPHMFTGTWSSTATWTSLSVLTQDINGYYYTHYGNTNEPGIHSVSFGFLASSTVTNGSWRDGYIGDASIGLTDPETPTVTGGALKRWQVPGDGGAPFWEGRNNSTQWVKPQDRLAILPAATDPGLGVQKAWVVDNDDDSEDVNDSACAGHKEDPCKYDWSQWGDVGLAEFSARNMADGPAVVTLYAADPLGQQSAPMSFPIKVDSVPPVTGAPSGSLWAAREEESLPPEQQNVLTAGSHPISFNATDAGSGVTASGVERAQVRVDGVVEKEETQTCTAGNCSLSVNWSYDTAEFGGRHKIGLCAIDGAGNERCTTFFVNAAATGDLIYPVDGEITSSRIALQAKDNDDDFTGVKFQYRRRSFGGWTTINSYLTDDQGVSISGDTHALTEPGRHSKKLIWDVRTVLGALVPKETRIQVRAVFTGGPQEFKSRVSDVDLDDKGLSADNAKQAIGPGSVDLLTGNFSYSATDASLSSFGSPIGLQRTFNSLDPDTNPNGPFGPGWVASAPMGGISDYSSLVVLTEASTRDWVDVFDSAGQRIRFEKTGETTFKAQVGFEALTLRRVPTTGQPDKYTLTDLDGVVTTFVILPTTSKFVPSKVEQPGSQGTASYDYETYLKEPRLKRVVAPSPTNVNCNQPALAATSLPQGCRVLEFVYSDFPAFGAQRLTSIKQIASDGLAMVTDTVASFAYHADGRLAEAWDPRITPVLKETYSYTPGHRLATIGAPGEAPWSMSYFSTGSNYLKLDSVSRTADGSGVASWRMRYQVPLSTSAGGPYDLTSSALATWGQADRPIDATTILPPTETGTGYSKATISYLNQDGRIVNAAAPGGRISVAEYDPKGNVVRELSAANRAKALADGGDTALHAGLLSTHRTYSSNGLRLIEELGPEHEVKLDSGQVVDARAHTVTSYDEGYTPPQQGPAQLHLPTTSQTGAQIDPSDPDVDVRTVKTEYDWTLRKPTRTIVDAGSGGLNITRQTDYNAAGLETASRQPKSNGSDAGTTRTVYYGDSGDSACSGHIEWFNLPCKTKPAAQPGTSGLPNLPVTTYTYDRYGNVLTAVAQTGGASRTTTTTYDAGGRKLTDGVTTSGGGGVPNGLVAAYGFDEGSGTNVTDSSGHGNGGTISGAAWSSSGKFDKALDFDGTNDKVSVLDSNSLDLTNGMTLSAWVKPDTLGGYRTLVMKERPSNLSYALYGGTDTSNRPAVEVSGNQRLAPSAVSTGSWTHLAGTYDGANLRIYVNGVEVSSESETSTMPASSNPLSIGGNSVWGEYFDGLIDEVRVYNRALSQTEIQADKDTSVVAQTTSVGSLGEPVPTTIYGYSSTTGRSMTVSAGGKTTTIIYDNIGRVTDYTDADGVTSETEYDNLNRPTTTGDGKGTQNLSYDSTTGLLTSLNDSHAGTFTASYDADGRMVSKTYPNGMKADTTYDPSGSPIKLKYTKTSNCSANCVWIDEQVAESIHGQWRTHSWELSSQEYSYDKAGRLTRVEDDVQLPAAVAGCTIRSYAFDANSNRTSMNTKAPAGNGDCQQGATGTSKTYSYDGADRLTGTGIQYDQFGRMTSIPAQHSGGGVLTYTYYANDQVRSISQDGISKTYALDPLQRQYKTLPTGGTTNTGTYHYKDGSDSPSWGNIVNGQGQEVAWARDIEGIDGDLAAIQTHTAQGDTTVLQLQNLHGDIIATASTDPNATALADRFESDEFGNPRQQQAGRRYGWLGGKQRRAELASGVIQMGVRSYIPALGRFTSVDPVRGGSSNAYDYAGCDPVNSVDLDGRVAKCGKLYRDKGGRSGISRLKRTGAGETDGRRWVKYQIHIQLRAKYSTLAYHSKLEAFGRGPNVGRKKARLNQDENFGPAAYYAHVSVRAWVGTQVSVRGLIEYAPVKEGNEILYGYYSNYSCKVGG